MGGHRRQSVVFKCGVTLSNTLLGIGMSRNMYLFKVLVAAEFCIAFAFPVAAIVYGVKFLPFVLVWLPLQPLAATYVLAVILFGIIGIFSVTCLLFMYLWPQYKIISPNRAKKGVFFGVLSAVALIVYSFNVSVLMLASAVSTIVVSVHLLWLNRQYLYS